MTGTAPFAATSSLAYFSLLSGHKGPEAVEVDGGAVVAVLGLVEVTHTNLAEETRGVFVEVDAVVVLATRVTATTRVLAVLSDTALTVRHVAARLPGLLQTCRHVPCEQCSPC